MTQRHSEPTNRMTFRFTPTQVEALQAPLNKAFVKERSQSGRTLFYIEGWVAISEANRIFGFDCWNREISDCKCVSERERKVGRDQRPGWAVTYIITVRVTIGLPDGGKIVREGTGAGHGIDVDLGQAHESAVKEAETDAMKRALMTFGNPFGLALYDKQQAQVTAKPQPPAPPAFSQPEPSNQPKAQPAVATPSVASAASVRSNAPEPSAVNPAEQEEADAFASLVYDKATQIGLNHVGVKTLLAILKVEQFQEVSREKRKKVIDALVPGAQEKLNAGKNSRGDQIVDPEYDPIDAEAPSVDDLKARAAAAFE